MKKQWLTEKDYQFIYSRVPRVCLDFIIMQDKKVLLSKRDINPFKGYWHLPGGMVRYKETINQAAKRIIQEELHQKISSKKFIGYMEMPKDGPVMHNISIAFLAKLKKDSPIKGSFQAQEIDLFPKLPQKIHPVHKVFIKQNLKVLFK
jgi:ADP-ribose pyrophosphatase YjhB (NUDIX family)